MCLENRKLNEITRIALNRVNFHDLNFLQFILNLYNGWAKSQFTYFPMRDWFERIPCLLSRLETYFWTGDCSRKFHVFINVQLQFALISWS